MLTPTHVDPLAMGAWLAAVARGPGGLARLSREIRPAFVISSLAIALIFLTARGKVVTLSAWNRWGIRCWRWPVPRRWCAITSAERSLGGRFWRSSVMGYLGRRSYAIYVLYPLTLFLVIHWGFDLPWFAQRFGSQLAGQAVFGTIMVGVSAGVAYLSWYCWEQPFLRLKSRFTMKASRTGDQALTRSQPSIESIPVRR